MSIIWLLINYLIQFIKILIFIIGKTIVLYILVFKSWYFDIINFFFHPDYNNVYHCNLIILIWNIFSWFLQFLLILLLIYLSYLYFLFLKFLFLKILKELNKIFKNKK